MSSGVQASIWRALPVWVWFDYAEEPARYIQLNLRALQRHAPSSHFSIHFVNRSNIASFVPDLNEAFWRLSKHVAFSDAGRLALLAHHGGIYLDADFLVTSSLVPVATALRTAEVVGYPASPVHGFPASASECARSGEISANFIAVRISLAHRVKHSALPAATIRTCVPLTTCTGTAQYDALPSCVEPISHSTPS